MTQSAALEKSSLLKLLGRVVAESRLMAPVRRGKKSFAFEWIDDPEGIVFDYVRSILPPKKALLPPREKLLDFCRGAEQAASPTIDRDPLVLFGVHPCDLAAIEQIDWAFARKDGVEDPYFAARRRAATIVGIDCTPDTYCFCTSVGTEATRCGADLFLTPIESGYLVEVLTPKGEALLSATEAREATAEEESEAAAWRAEKARCITRRLEADASELPDVLDRRYESEIWDQTAGRCYSCGTCTNVCPTCICFDVRDEVNLPLSSGSRSRQWDSCQFLDFALVAGPHNFRAGRFSRVRHRWLRKFAYLNRRYGRPFCTGCGRCTQACTADIGLTEVLNEIIAEDKAEGS